MKVTIIILAAVAGVAATFSMVRGLTSPQPDQQSNRVASTSSNSPFACDILALTQEQRKRHFDELGPMLRSMKKSVRELPDGYEFEFPADANTYALVTEWSIQERACCPFFDIDIRLDREGGPIWLRLTGREGTKQFIQSDAAPWLN
ncbi:MAG TPA: hypothetical protein VGJ02_02440 [Pyrinomonadaceae bacterium]|jgi:hypothetical protein